MSHRYLLPHNVQLARGERTIVRIEKRCIALFNIDDVIYAIDDSCPHGGASLAGGKLDGRTVQCPAHGLRFRIDTGAMQPATGLCVRTYPISHHEGQLVITLPAEASVGVQE
jgi:nitrite reductase/ring-hydroxylating ferredoxin subunit